MKLTPLQTKILNHRLYAPDAIFHCLSEMVDEEGRALFPNLTLDDVTDICGRLLSGDYIGAMVDSPELARRILHDAIDGGTWMGCARAEFSEIQAANHQRAADALARKVSEFTGLDAVYPES